MGSHFEKICFAFVSVELGVFQFFYVDLASVNEVKSLKVPINELRNLIRRHGENAYVGVGGVLECAMCGPCLDKLDEMYGLLEKILVREVIVALLVRWYAAAVVKATNLRLLSAEERSWNDVITCDGLAIFKGLSTQIAVSHGHVV